MAHRYLGWKRQPFDHRDFHFRPTLRVLRSLPQSRDLSGDMCAPLDQGAIGCCGPNTADECLMYDQKVEKLPVASLARLFIYYVTRMIMGTLGQDSGVDNRSMLKGLNQYGAPPESMYPYVTSQYNNRPPQSVFDAALANRISNYAAVQVDLLQMKGTIDTGFPFIFGSEVFQQIMSDQAAENGIILPPKAGETPIGGHDITFCGFSDVDLPGVKPGNKWPANHFRFRNHWVNSDGTPWGDGSYGYWPYDMATNTNYAGDFWVINAIPGASPAPVPPTPPVPPAPPAPSPVQKLFSIHFNRACPRGGWFGPLRAPILIPAGDYDVIPQQTVSMQHLTAIPWATLWLMLQHVAQVLGPLAIPLLDGYIQNATWLTADQKQMIVNLLNSLKAEQSSVRVSE
jgi:hypothetical protein